MLTILSAVFLLAGVALWFVAATAFVNLDNGRMRKYLAIALGCAAAGGLCLFLA